MENRTSPPVRSFLPAAILMMLSGWAGLAAILLATDPTAPYRWLFFFAAVIALTGTFLPLVAYLNRRFPSTPPPSSGAVLRQAIWFGVYFATLAWFQIGRVLNPGLALLLAVGLVLIEALLRLRERSQWKP
jgi:hypothetical protein